MTPHRTLPRLALAASGWVALLATTLPEAAPLRVAVVTPFLLVCPGLAAVLAMRAAAPAHGMPRYAVLEAALLSLMLGLALATLVAVGLFLGGAFTATRGLVVLAALTSVLALLPRRHRARERDGEVQPGGGGGGGRGGP
ncbi:MULTISPECIES: hypothetical protein [Streptomyces]|uniref:hypothetical protein n=1 Tax=Streptomyces TaxID=1883 RepID=UPI0006899087|nr:MULTISPECIES: hypothetical protein [Streptomyces]